MFQTIVESYADEKLLQSMKMGIINVIPKNGRDVRHVKNLRPITLLNTDYKIIEKLVANRIVPWLNDIIHEDQRGFVPGRRAAVNIRKIFDIVHEVDNSGSPCVILQADLVKAFDRVEHQAIRGTLEFFGFAEYIIKWIEILYDGFKVRVQNNGHLSETINVNRSVHQGGCCSAAIFVCVAEILARDIRENSQIRGAFIKEIENILTLFADDTDATLDAENSESLNGTLKCIERFGKRTGLLLNYEKTNVYRIGSLKNSDAKFYTTKELNWKNGVINVLGVCVSNDIQEAVNSNYDSLCTRAEKKLNSWKRRTLSLLGKISIINTLVASMFVYTMTVLPPIPDKYITRLERMFTTFLWNGHRAKIPMETLMADKKHCGGQLINLKIKDMALKAAWVKIIFSDYQIADIAHSLIAPILGFNLWRCNMNGTDAKQYAITMTDNTFWIEVLRCWCIVNYSVNVKENQYLWLNSNIRIQGRCFFWPKHYLKGLMYVQQLFSGNDFIDEDTAYQLYGLDVMNFNSIKAAIPHDMKIAAKQGMLEEGEDLLNSIIMSKHAAGKLYKKLIQKNLEKSNILARKIVRWEKLLNQQISQEELITAAQNIYCATNVPKYRSFQLRLLNQAIITNVHLFRWGKKQCNSCSFCEIEPETIKHLFSECVYVQSLWCDTVQWLKRTFLLEDSEIKFDNVKEFLFNPKGDRCHLIQFINVVFKQYVYKQRCLKKRLSVNELCNTITNIEKTERYIACKSDRLIHHLRKWNFLDELDEWQS